MKRGRKDGESGVVTKDFLTTSERLTEKIRLERELLGKNRNVGLIDLFVYVNTLGGLRQYFVSF